MNKQKQKPKAAKKQPRKKWAPDTTALSIAKSIAARFGEEICFEEEPEEPEEPEEQEVTASKA
jgi:hypothetical protein